MSIRTVCFVGAIVVGAGMAALGLLIAAALVLPYVAVVMANASTSKSDGFDAARPRLRSARAAVGPDPTDAPGTDHI